MAAELVEPPQPQPMAPPLRQVAGPEAAPAIADGDPGLVPDPTRKKNADRLPPPDRPPYSGVGMFVTAGMLFALAVTEQAVAHVLVAKECIRPIAGAEVIEADDFGRLVSRCAPGVVPALALQLHAGLNLAGAIGFAAAGGYLRAERDAWNDVFGRDRRRKDVVFRATGLGLVAAGFVTWLATSAAAWAILSRCDTGGCAEQARLMGFATRDVGVVLMASGVGLVTYGETYRRRHGTYTRERRLLVSPLLSPAGLSVAARF